MEYCNGKVKYDKRGAQTASNHRFNVAHTKLRIYHCEWCNGWHLTHKENMFDLSTDEE